MELQSQVKAQLEFYFSDSNFRRDAFLRNAAESNPEGFVPLTTLLTFKKLKAMTEDLEVLQKSIVTSEKIELNKDQTAVRRINPLPEVDDSAERTLIVSPIPNMEQEPTIEQVSKLFASAGGEVIYVRIRRESKSGKFIGLFIEFKTAADAIKTRDANIEIKFDDSIQSKEMTEESAAVEIKTEESDGPVEIKTEEPAIAPRVLLLADYLRLSKPDKVDFDKNTPSTAMIHITEIPEVSFPDILHVLKGLWADKTDGKPFFEFLEKSNEAYILFKSVSFAKSIFKEIESGFKIKDTVVQTKLILDVSEIMKRKRRPENRKRKSDDCAPKRKEQVIHLANIGEGVTWGDIKDAIATASDVKPFVEYIKGQDSGRLRCFDNAKIKSLFEKLTGLENKVELGGKVVNFELVEIDDDRVSTEVQYMNGVIVNVAGLSEQVTREDLKVSVDKCLSDEGSLRYVQFCKGDSEAFLRFDAEAAAKKIVEIVGSQDGIEVCDKKIETARLLEGDEEKEFWKEIENSKQQRMKSMAQNKRRKCNGGGRGGGRGRGRGRRD